MSTNDKSNRIAVISKNWACFECGYSWTGHDTFTNAPLFCIYCGSEDIEEAGWTAVLTFKKQHEGNEHERHDL